MIWLQGPSAALRVSRLGRQHRPAGDVKVGSTRSGLRGAGGFQRTGEGITHAAVQYARLDPHTPERHLASRLSGLVGSPCAAAHEARTALAKQAKQADRGCRGPYVIVSPTRALPGLAEHRVDPLAGKSSGVPAKYSRARGLSESAVGKLRYSTGSAKEHVNHPLPAHRDVADQSRLQQAQLPVTPKSFSSNQPEPSWLFFALGSPPDRGKTPARIARCPLVAVTMEYRLVSRSREPLSGHRKSDS
ncbi:hypothetical protein L1887_54160 [Cichorium endivia]|nr:hypothetical protein L1887_54160 [Cichorium endivia]